MKDVLTKFVIGICEVAFFLLFLTVILPLQGIQWIWEEWRDSFCPRSDGGMYSVMVQRMHERTVTERNGNGK